VQLETSLFEMNIISSEDLLTIPLDLASLLGNKARSGSMVS
jgi:hypothetical protein